MHYTRTQLTGKVRYRAGWFGRLIPEVEVEITHLSRIPPHPMTKLVVPDKFRGSETYWRKMKAEDIKEVM